MFPYSSIYPPGSGQSHVSCLSDLYTGKTRGMCSVGGTTATMTPIPKWSVLWFLIHPTVGLKGVILNGSTPLCLCLCHYLFLAVCVRINACVGCLAISLLLFFSFLSLCPSVSIFFSMKNLLHHENSYIAQSLL